MKRKNEGRSSEFTHSILLCGHAAWNDSYETTIIPENTALYIYAPLGSALTQQVVRAIAAGENIKSGDLQFRKISPLTLFNLGYEDNDEGVGQYKSKILTDYPLCLKSGDEINNFRMSPPGKAALQSKNGCISVFNIDNPNGVFLEELLHKNKGKTCHFGGCSWVNSEFDKRNIVDFANPTLSQLYKDPPKSDEEKMQLRKMRFNNM